MKNLKIATFTILILTTFVCLIFAQEMKTKNKFSEEKGIGLTTTDITQKRDMSLYIKGGHFDCRDFAEKDELSLDCDSKKARDFIWENWTKKKRAYLTISADSIDSTSTLHIFIEPNKKGNWTIAGRIARFHAISKPPYYIDDLAEVVSVTRVENESMKDEWSLVYKDKSEKVVKAIFNFLN
jgi:hypothetical protein